MSSLAKFWWVLLPRFLRRVAITPAAALTDGYYIPVFPSAAAFLPPLVFLAGLLFGWLHPGFETVFSESLVFLIIIVALGVLSAHLGAMFLTGFALGDYFLFNPAWLVGENFLKNFLYHFAFIIEYALLAILLVQIPLVTKALLAQFYKVLKFGQVASVAFAVSGHIVLSVSLVLLWTQMVPVLIRPVWIWANDIPSYRAMTYLQESGLYFLIATAIVASIIRMTLQSLTTFSTVYSQRLAVLEEAVSGGDTKPFTERIPAVIRAFFIAAWSALLLSGLYSGWIDAVSVGLVVFALQMIRFGILPIPMLAKWSQLTEKVPLLFRLVIGSLIVAAISAAVLPLVWGDSFRPVLVLVIFAIVLFYLLNPGISSTARKPDQQTV